ncbi:MAG: MerR family transcriptional regulator [Cytophagales bacterium]|nr:MerR family transcriptional regulator [Cytophagales bacterium]
MSNYTIKDIEILSGIKAHTLRIWEQRYGLIDPKRTDTNIRIYTDKDLKMLLNISFLNQHGYKISKIAGMSSEYIHEAVMRIADSYSQYEDQIQSLTIAMLDMDEQRFEKTISNNVERHGLENTIIYIVYPFLSRIGVMWQTDTISPGQEHFISNLIRQKIIVAIDTLSAVKTVSDKVFVLYLAEGELHELSLLFAHYIIKSRGHKSLYLGQWLPMADLVKVYNVHKPQYLVTIFTTLPGPLDIENHLQYLSHSFPDCNMLVSGNQIQALTIKTAQNIHLMTSINSLITFVENL